MKDEIKKYINMAEKGAGFTYCEYKEAGDVEGPEGKVGPVKATHLVAYDKEDFKNAHEFARILNYLPELFKDVDTLTKIVVAQQKQISKLQGVIETVALGRIQIEGVNAINEHHTNLAKQTPLKEVGGGELTLKVSSSFFSENDEAQSSTSEGRKSHETDVDLAVGVGGIMELIADLNISGGTKEMINSLEKASSSMKRSAKEGLTMTGEAIYKTPSMKFKRNDLQHKPCIFGRNKTAPAKKDD